jgi:hypothetical protein
MALLSLARHARSLHVTPARRMSRLLIACPCCCLRSAGVLAGSFDSLVLPSAFNVAPGFARCAAPLAKSGHPYSPSSCQAYSLHVLAHPKYQPSPRKPMPPNRLAWPDFSHSRAPVRYWDALIALPHTFASHRPDPLLPGSNPLSWFCSCPFAVIPSEAVFCRTGPPKAPGKGRLGKRPPSSPLPFVTSWPPPSVLTSRFFSAVGATEVSPARKGWE